MLIMRLHLKFILLATFILFSTQNMAVSLSDGIAAVKNEDYTGAVKIWTQLADAGDSVAQYNLSDHFFSGKGVNKNKNTAELWLQSATRSGLIQAYLDLNKLAVAPANGLKISFITDPALWLSKQEPDEYTIQLSSSRYEKSIKKLYAMNNIKGKGGYYHYVRDGVDRYALIYGSYKTVAAAKTAITELPSDLRKTTPWVRKIKSLQNISQ